MGFVLRATVKSDLSDVACFRQQSLEQRSLTFSLVNKLRMQSQCCLNAFRAYGQCRCAGPSSGGCRYRQDIQLSLLTLLRYNFRIGVEIQMTMKVNHFTPYFRWSVSTSVRPRSTTPLKASVSPRVAELSVVPSQLSRPSDFTSAIAMAAERTSSDPACSLSSLPMSS